MHNFGDVYRQLVADYYRPLNAKDGLAESEVTACERELGYALPQVLRDFYLAAGNLNEVNDAHHHLVCPSELAPDPSGRSLIFYDENQHVVSWGIDLRKIKESDPPVLQGINPKPRTWGLEFSRLSDFLIMMFYLQLVEGNALGYGGLARIDERQFNKLAATWPSDVLVKEDHQGGPTIFCTPGQVLLVTKEVHPYRLHVAARTRDDFLQVEKVLAITWRLQHPKPG
jgi:hypothetical protein